MSNNNFDETNIKLQLGIMYHFKFIIMLGGKNKIQT